MTKTYRRSKHPKSFLGGVIYGLTRGIFFDNKYVRKRKRLF